MSPFGWGEVRYSHKNGENLVEQRIKKTIKKKSKIHNKGLRRLREVQTEKSFILDDSQIIITDTSNSRKSKALLIQDDNEKLGVSENHTNDYTSKSTKFWNLETVLIIP